MARTPGSNTIMYLPLTSSTTTQDKSGNGYNMTNKNGATFGTYYGVSCAHFVDNTSYLQYNGNPLSGTPGAFTVSNWFYIESTPNQYHQNQWGFGYGGTENPTSSIMLWGNYTKLMLGGWSNDHDTGYSYSLNKWYHVAVTYTPGTVKTYVNGKLVDSWSKTYSGIKTNYVRIGHYVYDRTIEDSGINGCISEFIVENKARTATEVQSYYNDTAWQYGLAPKPTILYGSSPIKEIYFGNPGGSRLPSAYQEVEYIQSSGTQHINTGYYHTANTEVEIKFNHQSSGGTYDFYGIYGGRTAYNSADCLAIRSQSGSSIGYGIGGKYNNYLMSMPRNTDYTVKFNKSSITVNGTTTSLSTSLTSCSYQDYIFCMNNSGSITDYKISAKIYYCKVSENGTLKRDFVPCYRKSDNVIGMYDLINNQFYTNNGTGTFTKGANVTYNYTPIKEVYYGSTKIRPAKSTIIQEFTNVLNTYVNLNKSGYKIVKIEGQYQANFSTGWVSAGCQIRAGGSSSNVGYRGHLQGISQWGYRGYLVPYGGLVNLAENTAFQQFPSSATTSSNGALLFSISEGEVTYKVGQTFGNWLHQGSYAPSGTELNLIKSIFSNSVIEGRCFMNPSNYGTLSNYKITVTYEEL